MQLSFFENEIIKARPVLKWAGGKTQMLNKLLPEIPLNYNKYIEPFFGGGALFFELSPENSVISDANPELINLYNILSNNVDELIKTLKKMENNHSEEFFYEIRSKNTDSMSDLEKASRTIYLNKTCFNGLYRVNKKGQFNVPYGRYKNPKICDEENLLAASKILRNTTIIYGDYKDVLNEYAEPGDFIFLDPPYLPISKHSNFKRYTKEQFHEKDHRELADEVKRLKELGCYILLTNSNHPLVHELYRDYDITIHKTKRNINSKGLNRTGEDVLVKIDPY